MFWTKRSIILASEQQVYLIWKQNKTVKEDLLEEWIGHQLKQESICSIDMVIFIDIIDFIGFLNIYNLHGIHCLLDIMTMFSISGKNCMSPMNFKTSLVGRTSMIWLQYKIAWLAWSKWLAWFVWLAWLAWPACPEILA